MLQLCIIKYKNSYENPIKIYTLFYQVCEVLDGEANSLISGRVQGFFQKSTYGSKLQYLDGVQSHFISLESYFIMLK